MDIWKMMVGIYKFLLANYNEKSCKNIISFVKMI